MAMLERIAKARLMQRGFTAQEADRLVAQPWVMDIASKVARGEPAPKEMTQVTPADIERYRANAGAAKVPLDQYLRSEFTGKTFPGEAAFDANRGISATASALPPPRPSETPTNPIQQAAQQPPATPGGLLGARAGPIGPVADMPSEQDSFLNPMRVSEPSPFFDAVRRAEGTTDAKAQSAGFASGYDLPLGYGKYGRPAKPLTEMTLREAYDFGNQIRRNPSNPHNSSALGAFQIVGSTLKDVMGVAGLSWGDKFSPENQRMLAAEIAKRQGTGAWEGFKRNPGDLQIAKASLKSGPLVTGGGPQIDWDNITPASLDGAEGVRPLVGAPSTVTPLDKLQGAPAAMPDTMTLPARKPSLPNLRPGMLPPLPTRNPLGNRSTPLSQSGPSSLSSSVPSTLLPSGPDTMLRPLGPGQAQSPIGPGSAIPSGAVPMANRGSSSPVLSASPPSTMTASPFTQNAMQVPPSLAHLIGRSPIPTTPPMSTPALSASQPYGTRPPAPPPSPAFAYRGQTGWTPAGNPTQGGRTMGTADPSTGYDIPGRPGLFRTPSMVQQKVAQGKSNFANILTANLAQLMAAQERTHGNRYTALNTFRPYQGPAAPVMRRPPPMMHSPFYRPY